MTDYVYVSGKAKWLRHQTPNEWGRWAHTIYLNQESLNKVKALIEKGLKNQLRHDEDGDFMVFARPQQKMIRGKVVAFTPPELFMSDGSTPLKGVLVGNGSDVTTKLEVYEHKTPGGGKAVAARWLSTRVDNLIPFESNRDLIEREEQASRGLPEQPPQPAF